MAKPDADHQGRVLVAIARDSISHTVLGSPEQEWGGAPWLEEPGATFVTIRHRGALRGCLGSLEAQLPLIDDVQKNARAAASRDPRFPPLTPEELADTEVEVSLLSPLERVGFTSEEDALEKLGQGRDGWVLEYQSHTGTFLPQVWEALPQPQDFLRRLKEKAGLAASFWSPEIRLWRYEVKKWCESDFG
ncbi:MAG: AmmeMemoRadiSam system protein A [bacterium]|nr:AmmeMemoRadiSam system protein A [bacterium]